eukprot:scaffold493787_cov94-Attheya_sp.AAC.1
MATGIVTAFTLCMLPTTAMAWSQPCSSVNRHMRMKPTVHHAVAGNLQQRTPTALYHAERRGVVLRQQQQQPHNEKDLTSIHGESDEFQLKRYQNRAQVLQHLVQSQQGELRKYQTR